jgi:hypothetical protein
LPTFSAPSPNGLGAVFLLTVMFLVLEIKFGSFIHVKAKKSSFLLDMPCVFQVH